ncbi:MAG: hypothetical protein IPK53_11510 [bacterium]|nr:hypothetical protein [bacterium]
MKLTRTNQPKETIKMIQHDNKPRKHKADPLPTFAEQPIVHTEETIGNISKLKKCVLSTTDSPNPFRRFSGNSFRGQLRDILG